jgi:hypothetical protein
MGEGVSCIHIIHGEAILSRDKCHANGGSVGKAHSSIKARWEVVTNLADFPLVSLARLLVNLVFSFSRRVGCACALTQLGQRLDGTRGQSSDRFVLEE